MGSLPYIQANTNGRLHDASEASFSPLNRGFLYGDAVYEVWRTYDHVLFAVAEHWSRLQASAAALHMPLPFGCEEWVEQAARTAAAFRARTGYDGELYVRLQITRGSGPIGLDIALAGEVEWVTLVQPVKTPELSAGRAGLHLAIARELHRNAVRALNPAWKTGNYLNNLLCLREARSRGADEVIILNADGAVTESAVCNICFVRGDEVMTPALSCGLLAGITRSILLSTVATRAGVGATEAIIRPGQFSEFTECFLTATTRDIIPVERIDEHAFTINASGIAVRLKQAFGEFAREYAQAHPEWRM